MEAYRVCEQFRTIMSEELNFDRAFESTFAKDRFLQSALLGIFEPRKHKDTNH
jgi:hypothetical protein